MFPDSQLEQTKPIAIEFKIKDITLSYTITFTLCSMDSDVVGAKDPGYLHSSVDRLSTEEMGLISRQVDHETCY